MDHHPAHDSVPTIPLRDLQAARDAACEVRLDAARTLQAIRAAEDDRELASCCSALSGWLDLLEASFHAALNELETLRTQPREDEV